MARDTTANCEVGVGEEVIYQITFTATDICFDLGM